MEDLLQVGVITSTHGIRGEVKVFPTTDDAARFKKLKNVILDNGKERRDLEITSVKFFKNQVILKFKGIDDINDVEKYKKAPLFVTRENAVPLEENEYFIADLIGLSVTSDEGEELGVIDDVLQTGANDVYVVKKAGANDLLIPAIKYSFSSSGTVPCHKKRCLFIFFYIIYVIYALKFQDNLVLEKFDRSYFQIPALFAIIQNDIFKLFKTGSIIVVGNTFT